MYHPRQSFVTFQWRGCQRWQSQHEGWRSAVRPRWRGPATRGGLLMDELEALRVSRRNVMKAGAAGAALSTAPFLFTNQAQAQDVPEVARNRTLILRWGGREGRHIDAELWNGYALGAN